jgi:hypothetical protein
MFYLVIFIMLLFILAPIIYVILSIIFTSGADSFMDKYMR